MMNFKVYGTKIAINVFCYVKVRSINIIKVLTRVDFIDYY